MKRILFPTDFSDTANNAFLYSLFIADKLNASITSLHVYKVPELKGVNMPNTLAEFYYSIDVEEFDNYKDKIPLLHDMAHKYHYGHVALTNLIEKGDTVRKILSTAKKTEAEMIVMGTTGASRLKNMLIGSVTGEIMLKASCPVLAIPQAVKPINSIKRIAITTMFDELEKKALDKVILWAKNFGAQIFLVHVDTGKDTAVMDDKWKALIKKRKEISYFLVCEKNLFDGLNEFVQSHQIDLLAMLAHERTHFQQIYRYSIPKQMSHYSSIPILAIPEKMLEMD